MAMTRPKWISTATRAVIVIAVLVATTVIYQILIRTAPEVQMTDTTNTIRRVMVFRAQKHPVRRQWQGYGTAEAMDSANVPARVSATVLHIAPGILPGAAVKKDQVLAVLDDRDFQRRVEIEQHRVADLEAQFALLEVERGRLAERVKLEESDVELTLAELERAKQLVESRATNRQDLEQAKREFIASERTRLFTAEAIDKLGPRRASLQAQRRALASSLHIAKLNFERCRITSPIDGILQAVDIEVGENIAVGQRIARVVRVDLIEVPLRLPSAARADLAVGNQIALVCESRDDLYWSAHIARISPEDDATTRTMTVFAELNRWVEAERSGTEGRHLLTPGTFVGGVATSDRIEHRWVVPRRSIREGRVLLVDDGVILSRPVRVAYVIEGRIADTDLPDDQWAVLDDDLIDGELIVGHASSSLMDGQAVEPVLSGSAEQDAQAHSRKEPSP